MERRGKKSVAQTPAPKKDRIYGSERNPKGSASSSKSASKIELSESIINTLENKRDEYNAKHPSGKVTLATLKAVFRRGAGAYSSSHRPTITGGRPNSRSAWAFARVNKFLLKKGGTKVKAAYVQDDDLMEMGGEITWDEYVKTQFDENENRYLPENYFEEFTIQEGKKEDYPTILKEKDGLEYRKWKYGGIGVFDENKKVGFADNGSIQVSSLYQKRGIGIELVSLLKELNPSHRFGNMTPQGWNLMRSYYNKKVANRYDDGGLTDSLRMAMGNIKKNGIVLKDKNETITLIAYNTGNQERKPSLYNKSLIYKSVQPIKSANEIIQKFDLQEFEMFSEGKIEEYKKSHLIILNQNEVVYDSSVLAEGGDLGQEITCVNCGWHWNTNNSDEFDKYVCHKCGFDNRTYYDSDPIGKFNNGGKIENEFDDLDNNRLVKILKSFYSDLSESPIFQYLDLKVGDYTLNIGENEFVIFKKKPFSKIEAIKIGRFIQPYFDASKKPLFARFFDSYTVSGNNIIIKVKDMYENGGIIDETYNKVLQGSINSDDGAIYLYENGIEVTDDIYDRLRDAEQLSLKKERGLQVGDIITIKGKYGNSDFKGNFRGYTNEGKLIVVYEGGKQMAINKDEYYEHGGLLKKAPSLLKIADKHNVDLETVSEALKNGIKVEMEHTKNKSVAKTIASHHLYESPKYYEKLKVMEKELNLDEHYEDIRKIYNIGGVVDPVLSFSTPTGEPSKLTYLQQVLVRTNAFKKFFGDWEYAGNQFVKNGRQEYEYLYRNVSKVIDKITLEPKVVYHGTRVDSEFYVFDVSQQSGLGRPYGYFAHNMEYSENFTSPQMGITNGQPFLYKCFVNIRNPFYAMTSEYYDIQEDAQYWKNEISKTIALDKYTNELDANKLKTIKDVVESQIGKYIDDTFRSSEASFWVLMARDNKKLFKYFLNNYRYDGVFYAEEFSNNYNVDNPAEFTEAVTIFEPMQVKLADGRNLNFDPMNVDIRYAKGGDTDNVENTEEKYNNMGKRENLRNLLLGDKYAEGGEVVANKLKDGNDGKKGGYFEGRSHAEGGIKAYNKDTGQMIEVEGEEVIITKGAVKDPQKREFEGEMLTNREILSRINQSGGGVSFASGGETGASSCGCSGKKYKYGGEMMDDYSIVRIMNRPFEIINDNFADARAFADMLVNKLK